MLTRRALIGLALGWAMSAAHAQTAPSPADVGISKGNPDVFKLLDNTKNWTPFGSVNTNTHIFMPATNGPIPTGNCMKWGPGLQDAGVSCGTGTGTPAFSEADLLVTDPAIGMVSGGTDNLPFVSALMSAIGPSTGGNGGGYDVLFPGVHGQPVTEYYFSNSLHITRGAQFHCGGAGTAAGGSQTYLIFASGVDGVIEDSYNMTSDGGGAAGTLSGCNIWSMGYGSAAGNPIWNTNVLTNVTFYGDPASVIPNPTWHVGDGLILVAYFGGFYSADSILVAPIGTTVTAVDGATGNLTLSNPVNPASGSVFQPKGTAVFTETGTNNFSNNDTIHVGPTTYTLVNVVNNSIGNSALIGPDFATSAANLVASVMHTAGEGVKYWPGVRAADQLVTAAASGNTITFTSNFGAPAVNAYPSIYTPTGTAAGAFGGTHFTGANDASNCPSPCTAQNLDLRFFQLPAAQRFKVQTTAGSSTMTVVSGPRLLQGGDVVWSDAFPLGTTVYTDSSTGSAVPPGTAFPYTVTMAGPTNAPPAQNATVTHAPGAEGDLWIMHAGEKRRQPMSSIDNYLQGWPIGLSMSCSSANGLNCDLSRDRNVWHRFNFVGRWASGNNYATASSTDEQYAHNFFADVWDGGTLGEVYVNINGESPESGSSVYSFLKNCANQNYATVFGGYVNGTGCVYGDLAHPSSGGPLFIGSLGGPMGNPSLSESTFAAPFTFQGGYDNQMCTRLGDGLGGVALAFSDFQCTTGRTWNLAWDPNGHAWSLVLTNHFPALTLTGDDNYVGYNTGGVLFQTGVQLGNGGDDFAADYRLLDAGFAPPASGRLEGDVRLNQHPLIGGSAAWTNINLQTGIFLTAPVVAGMTTGLSVTACPNPAPPVGTAVAAQHNTVNALDQVLGTFASCAALTLQLQAPSAFNSFTDATLEFLQWRPAAKIANDPYGFNWPAATVTDVATLAANSPCDGNHVGFSTVNNGQDATAAGYNAPVGATGSTMRMVFCDGTSRTYH